MSIINQMLKDLARRSKPCPDSSVLLSGLAISENIQPLKNKFQYRSIIMGIVMISILVFVINNSHFFKKNSNLFIENFSESQPAEYKSSQASEIDTSGLFLDPAKLLTMTAQVENEMTGVRFLLNKSPLYQVRSYQNDQLIIVLENTKMDTSVPINVVNSAIKSMKVLQQGNGNVQINFKLKQGAQLNHLGINAVGQFYEFQIDFSYKKDMVDIFDNPFSKEHKILTIKKISHDGSINEEYMKAIELAKQGHESKAIVLLSNLLEKSPNFHSARKTLALFLLKQGNITKAKKIINVGLQQKPESPSYIQLEAQVLVAEKKIKEALNLLQSSTPPLEQNPDYYSFIAALYQQDNRPKQAEKLYERLINLRPTNSIWWMGLGIACESSNQNTKALAAYQRANTKQLSPELKVYVETRIHELLNNEGNNSNG